jgi:hypothetical protein
MVSARPFGSRPNIASRTYERRASVRQNLVLLVNNRTVNPTCQRGGAV